MGEFWCRILGLWSKAVLSSSKKYIFKKQLLVCCLFLKNTVEYGREIVMTVQPELPTHPGHVLLDSPGHEIDWAQGQYL